jgi:hypothetical protein
MNIPFKDRLVKPSLSSGWISGFSDAECSFTGRVKSCWSSKLRRAPHLTFQILYPSRKLPLYIYRGIGWGGSKRI